MSCPGPGTLVKSQDKLVCLGGPAARRKRSRDSTNRSRMYVQYTVFGVQRQCRATSKCSLDDEHELLVERLPVEAGDTSGPHALIHLQPWHCIGHVKVGVIPLKLPTDIELPALEGQPYSLLKSIRHTTFILPTLFPSIASTMADTVMGGDLTPKFAPFLGMGGIAFAMIFGCTPHCTAPSDDRNTS